MVLPNFIFAGAPKSGSSTLFEYIKQHPDICMSKVKEPFFFDFNYYKGTRYYESIFDHYQGEKIIGEATVWYMSWQSVPERMYELLPNAKLLFVLRNPTERAFSNYLMDLRSGRYVPQQTFGYVIKNEKKIKGLDRRIVSGGLYYTHLARFEQYFPRDQMLIILYDDLKQNMQETCRRIYEFLDVDISFRSSIKKKYMTNPYLSNIERLAYISNNTPLFNYAWKQSKQFRNSFFDFSSRKKNVIDDEDKRYLLSVYQNDNSLLEKHLDADLSHWNI